MCLQPDSESLVCLFALYSISCSSPVRWLVLCVNVAGLCYPLTQLNTNQGIAGNVCVDAAHIYNQLFILYSMVL